MTDFQLQQGVVEFELPVVVPDFLYQIQVIDQNILIQAQASNFVYSYPTLPYLPNQQMPDSVYNLMMHYIKRGFNVVYDGVSAVISLDWSHPDIDPGMNNMFLSPAIIPTLSGWFKANTLYMCITSGMDLRSSPEVAVKRQIQFSVERAANMGLTSTTWGFPTVPEAVISNLYSDVFNQLTYTGFSYSYNNLTGVFNISWPLQLPGQISARFNAGEGMSSDLATFPKSSTTEIITLVTGAPIQKYQVVVSIGGNLYPADTSVASEGLQVIGVALQSASTIGTSIPVQIYGLLSGLWNWVDGAIYCDPNGFLTQSPSLTGWLLNVGTVVSPTSFIVDFGTPIFR